MRLITIMVLFYLSVAFGDPDAAPPLSSAAAADVIKIETTLAPLPGPAEDGAFAGSILCQQTTRYHLLFLPIWQRADGVVVSDDFCASPAPGLSTIPDPTQPGAPLGTRQTPGEWLSGSYGLVILILIAALVVSIGWTTHAQNRAQRRVLSARPAKIRQITEILLYAAIADGRLTPEKLDKARRIVLSLTPDDSISNADLTRVAQALAPRPSEDRFRTLLNGLSQREKRTLLDNARSVASAETAKEGSARRKTEWFLMNLRKATDLEPEKARA